MFLEFHGYIIDPKSRYLDLANITQTIPGWRSFGPWKVCDEGIKCSAGWMVLFQDQHRYQLSQHPELLIESYDGTRRELRWEGPPPTTCSLL